MYALRELEHWRERQLDEYQRAQIIDRLDRQRLLDEYQRAQAIDRMDQQVSTMSELARSLAGVDESVGVMEADLARLTAVARSALPAIVEHVALSAKRLAGIEQMLASPNETAASELVRSGSYALASAAELSATGSSELADDWLEQAVADLTRAVEKYQYRPESWHLLALALKQQGDDEAAAVAFTRCALYAVTKAPKLAAWAILMAAGTLREDLDQPAQAAKLLGKYRKQLNRCAEIHLALAVHHDDPEALPQALELAPILAADARIAGVESVELDAAALCQHEDGPVARLRHLEKQICALAAAAEAGGLTGISTRVPPLTLPELGVDALLRAETHIPTAVVDANRLMDEVNASLQQLMDTAQKAEAADIEAKQELRRAIEKASNERDRREEEFRRALQDALLDDEILQARNAVTRAQEVVTAAWRASWEADAEFRRISDSADFVNLVAPQSSRSFRNNDGLWWNIWVDFTEARTFGHADTLRTTLAVQRKAVAEKLAAAQKAENDAQNSPPQAASDWLQAVQDAERTRHSAARAKEHLDAYLEELTEAQLAATKYRKGTWWTKHYKGLPGFPKRRLRADLQGAFDALPESHQQVLYRDEQRLAEQVDRLDQVVNQLRIDSELRTGEAEQAERRARQLVELAREAAQREVEQDHQRVEQIARDADHRARQGAEEACRLAEQKASETAEAVHRARDATLDLKQSLEAAITRATASRGRIVPSWGSWTDQLV
ncbi:MULTISPECIES: hypothetical protein [Amycolatopsis]|uniref:Exonuclease SbcC n=1 Tax=Amycolatopsis bullii TaxID=941987 RepID=A0ABQ3K454_9PSEU|nr:hypothetical protein [Amycolatopsis bullii]GHF98341.1 hypothetical protein GCM10017567_11280 [Amycolatopsis bullii]